MTTIALAPAASANALPDSAARWQSTFDAIHDGSWSGSDGAHSVLLPDGRDLMVFGDTFGGSVTASGARRPDPPFFSNSMGITSRDKVTWVNKAGQPAIPGAADGTVYWPEAVVAAGGGLHVFANRVHRAGTEVSGIRVVGQALVTFDLNTWALRSITPLSAAAGDDDGSGIWWSAGAAKDGSDVYVYGVQHTHPDDYGRSVYVARVPGATMTQLSSWRYWNGAAWTKNRELPSTAQLITAEADTVVSVWRTGSTWNLVSQKYGMLGCDIELWTATSPQGPWKDTRVLYSIPACEYPDAMFYESAAHPEVPLASGNLLLSYCRNGSHDHIHADANWYKPQYVEASLRPAATS